MLNRFLAALMSCFVLLQTVAFAADDDISRLYNFTPGTTIQSSQINGEYNQIITTLNGKMSRAGVNTISGANTFSGANIFSGANTFSGVQTFSNAAGVTTNTITERSAASGVTIAGATSKLLVDSVNESTSFAGVSVDSLKIENGYAVQPGFIRGCVPSYTDATAITISATCAAADSTNTDIIVPSGALVIDMDNAAGALSRDTGAEASNTWYYVYLIKKSSDDTVSAVFSTTNELVSGTITMPTGYDKKRQLPFAVRNDGSSNILAFTIAEGWPVRPRVRWDLDLSRASNAGTPRVISAGTQTTFAGGADISAASYVPPISKEAMLHIHGSTALSGAFRSADSSLSVGRSFGITGANGTYLIPVMLSSTQTFDYLVTTGNVNVDVESFVITEFP